MAKQFIKPLPYYFKPIYTDEVVTRQLFNAFETLNINDLNDLIIKGININLFDRLSGRNGLHVVLNIDDSKFSESIKLPFVIQLIDKGIFINKQDNNFIAPIHIAVSKHYLKITELLLKNGAIIDLRDINGLTPFHMAMLRYTKPCPEKKK
jgi:ankyrin repeat protein